MENDQKPLFVWIRLTGKELYESNESPHKVEWQKLPSEIVLLFSRAAKTLNQRLSLCSTCGERAQLRWNGTCEACPDYDQAGTLIEYMRLYAELPEEYSYEGLEIQDRLDKLEGEASTHGLKFQIREGGLSLVEMEADND